jgi:4-aminobutyrate aminotransferase-like enzyme
MFYLSVPLWHPACSLCANACPAWHGMCMETKEPGGAETSYICSSLKDDANILTSIDGPHENVLVMKPPLCFDLDDAETFLQALGE